MTNQINDLYVRQRFRDELSQESFDAVTQLVREFRKKVIERVSEESDPDRACHLNIQLFPLSKPKKKR